VDVGKGVYRGRELPYIHPIIPVGHRGRSVGWGPRVKEPFGHGHGLERNAKRKEELTAVFVF
jgi:hypothetical protein